MLWKYWSEKRLTQGIAKGEEDACVEVIRSHYEAIFRFLCYLCNEIHYAEDITQETFVAAWSKIENFNGSSSLATWLHAIAYRKFLDWKRKIRYSAVSSENLLLSENHNYSQSPVDGLLKTEELQCLYQAIAKLDTYKRETIVMHYFQGLSYREMAQMLDTPTGTIKWRTSQALAKLKALMQARTEK